MNGFLEAERLLREWGFFGTFSRPDNSGARGTGGPAMSAGNLKRAGNFPYDNDDEEYGYGQPNGYDRGSRGAAGQIHNPITPKDVRHSAWDDAEEDHEGVDEAMGTPMNFGQSGESELGSSIPGTNGHGWSGKPVKPWDEDDEEGHCELYGKNVAEGGGPMGLHPDRAARKPQPIPNAPYKQDGHETAGEDEVGFALEFCDPKEMGGGSEPPSAIAVKATSTPFMQGQGRAGKSSRGWSSTGGGWQESAWRDAALLLKSL